MDHLLLDHILSSVLCLSRKSDLCDSLHQLGIKDLIDILCFPKGGFDDLSKGSLLQALQQLHFHYLRNGNYVSSTKDRLTCFNECWLALTQDYFETFGLENIPGFSDVINNREDK